MASPPTSTFESYAAVGNRDDLTDVIYNISPFDTPFMSAIDTDDAEAVLHEWQTDALAAASSSNQVEEGLDAATVAATATVRLSNTCQISDKVPRVSGTQQAVVKAGRGDELAYQVAKMARELKTDMEKHALSNTAEVGGSSGTARVAGALPTWIGTNESVGSGGVAPSGSDGDATRTDGTTRPFTETLLKDVLSQIWVSGGDPDLIMVGSFNKQRFSGFTGNATRQVGADDKKLYASIDIYDSDYGELQVSPNRFMRARDALVLQTDMWAIAYLRPFQTVDLAKTGDSERNQLLVEYTIESRNEKASGIVADLTSA